MPQYLELKKGYARVRVLPKDATRAYLLMMRISAGKLQVLPNNLYVLDEQMLATLDQNGIEYEVVEKK